jgi:chromosome segregation ATPase
VPEIREQHRQLLEQKESADRLLEEVREQNQRLLEARETAKADYESTLGAERAERSRLAELLQEATTALDRASQAAEPSSSQPHQAIPPPQKAGVEEELGGSELEVLRLRLVELEKQNRELSQILAGMGIRYRGPELVRR